MAKTHFKDTLRGFEQFGFAACDPHTRWPLTSTPANVDCLRCKKTAKYKEAVDAESVP